jgi:hypothetical protein
MTSVLSWYRNDLLTKSIFEWSKEKAMITSMVEAYEMKSSAIGMVEYAVNGLPNTITIHLESFV